METGYHGEAAQVACLYTGSRLNPVKKDGNEIPHCKRVSVVTELSNISPPMTSMLRNKFVITR